MMRVAMQQLCFKANNGDLAAYKRLVLLQDRYKKLYEQPQYCELCGSRLDGACKEQSGCQCSQGSQLCERHSKCPECQREEALR